MNSVHGGFAFRKVLFGCSVSCKVFLGSSEIPNSADPRCLYVYQVHTPGHFSRLSFKHKLTGQYNTLSLKVYFDSCMSCCGHTTEIMVNIKD